MQQTEVLELFGPMLRQGAQRRRILDYVMILLVLLILGAWSYSIWRNKQVPQITAIAVVPESVVIIGPAESAQPGGGIAFCPGDLFTVRYELAIDGEGMIYADDTAHYRNQTVKFSGLWRDYVKSGTRVYENPWQIPPRPDMAIDGQLAWAAGDYTRVISVAPSNMYISRYVPAATFEVGFTIRDDCP